MIRKELLRQTGEWYLWHSYKNENALLPVIVISFLSIFVKGCGIFVSIGIWIWYFVYCNKNNEALNNDSEILIERALWLKSYEEKGMLEEYKRVMGIL